MNITGDPTRARRIELILQQLDSIPTPSPIAMRLLSLASSENADIAEIISLIESDPGMTSRLLALSRRATTGLGRSITTVERAVLMLGLDAVRAMLLSVDIHEFMCAKRASELDEDPAGEESETLSGLDRAALWRHALAVACAAERITQTHPDRTHGVKPEEAFVCGLLHDIGKVALDLLLPRAFARAVEIASRRCEPVAAVERTLIGIDHAMVGKRLAEKWGLPDLIRDVVWLHGRPAKAIPDLPHRSMIGVVSAANELARLMHVGGSGNASPPSPISRIAQEWAFDEEQLEHVAASLHERVSARAAQLGMDEPPQAQLLVESLGAANKTLVQLNSMFHRRSQRSAVMESTLRAMEGFFDQIATASSAMDVLEAAVRCGCEIFGSADSIALMRSGLDGSWSVSAYSGDGTILGAAPIELELDPASLSADGRAAERLPEREARRVARALGFSAAQVAAMRPLVALHDDAGVAIILHTWTVDRERSVALAAWRSALATAAQRDQAGRMSERLTDLNTSLVEAQARASEAESLARLGELAAGAAHEMNTPLAIISGRAQLLRDGVEDEQEARHAADAIVDASNRLSDLIANLHFIADPPPLTRRAIDLTEQLPRIVRRVRSRFIGEKREAPPVRFVVKGPLPPAHVDPDLFLSAVEELVRNALEAEGAGAVELRVQTDPSDDRLIVSVRDDGAGMAPDTLAHAFDPFFSRKKAGRQRGLGLSRVRRIVELHGGRVDLDSAEGEGTTARITLNRWRRDADQQHRMSTAAA